MCSRVSTCSSSLGILIASSSRCQLSSSCLLPNFCFTLSQRSSKLSSPSWKFDSFLFKINEKFLRKPHTLPSFFLRFSVLKIQFFVFINKPSIWKVKFANVFGTVFCYWYNFSNLRRRGAYLWCPYSSLDPLRVACKRHHLPLQHFFRQLFSRRVLHNNT